MPDPIHLLLSPHSVVAVNGGAEAPPLPCYEVEGR
jgi:hypothetical protein